MLKSQSWFHIPGLNQPWILNIVHMVLKKIRIYKWTCVLAWRIPGMGEPGGLLSTGSQRVRHDWSNLAAAAVGFPCGSAGKESACNAGDLDSIPGLGIPGEGKGYLLQYSGLENSMDSIVLGVTKSQIRLSDFHTHTNGPAQFRNALTTVESSLTLGPP